MTLVKPFARFLHAEYATESDGPELSFMAPGRAKERPQNVKEPDVWYRAGEAEEHAHACYLYDCILDKRATDIINALKEAERFMAYFAGETNNTFAGPGTPKSCLADIRKALGKPLA